MEACTHRFDAQDGTSGSMFMGVQEVEALREVRPDLYEKLLVSELWPFTDTMAHPDLVTWLSDHWDEG